MRAASAAVLGAALAGCATSAPPVRDVFIPPYAEKGCWSRLYGDAEFGAPVRQLEGPVFVEALAGSPVIVPGLDKIPPQPLFTEIRSLVVGPNARITGYAEPLFRTPTLELSPGARVADLPAAGFYERVRSFAMQCVR